MSNSAPRASTAPRASAEDLQPRDEMDREIWGMEMPGGGIFVFEWPRVSPRLAPGGDLPARG